MIMISQLVYENILWLSALINNKEKYLSELTKLCFHLNLNSNYSLDDIKYLKSRMILVNPKRIKVNVYDGSILMGHIINYKYLCKFKSFSYLIIASSNMFWTRTGIENYVYKYKHSVGLEGIHNSNLYAPRYMRKSIIYNEVSKNKTRELWSYHEGTFYPASSVGRFVAFLNTRFSEKDIINHKYFPEEFLLQTYVLNFERNLQFHSKSRPLCWRIPGSKIKSNMSIVTHYIINNLSCKYYAIKRVFRDLSFGPTIRLQDLSKERCKAPGRRRARRRPRSARGAILN